MLLAACLVTACLPADPPDFRRDAGGARGQGGKRSGSAKKKSPAAAASVNVRLLDAGPRIDEVLEDDFEREALGPDWNPTTHAWKIEEGKLCVRGAKNHPVWLRRRLPRNARIEFDAISASPEGDIKAEAWGDGRSAASGATYDDATSYILVLGGWRNSLHVLARLNEHATARRELRLIPGSEDPRNQPLVEGKSYHAPRATDAPR
ncbi:MAG TPA: hypothetical protein VGK73_12340, partial [Polyangiaceae bacterium]